MNLIRFVQPKVVWLYTYSLLEFVPNFDISLEAYFVLRNILFPILPEDFQLALVCKGALLERCRF
jgi:hypothetical protein